MEHILSNDNAAVSVNYHGLPEYLRKQAASAAARYLGLSLRDLMMGRAEFRLSALNKETERRTIVSLHHAELLPTCN